jgi:hypothetical protein
MTRNELQRKRIAACWLTAAILLAACGTGARSATTPTSTPSKPGPLLAQFEIVPQSAVTPKTDATDLPTEIRWVDLEAGSTAAGIPVPPLGTDRTNWINSIKHKSQQEIYVPLPEILLRNGLEHDLLPGDFDEIRREAGFDPTEIRRALDVLTSPRMFSSYVGEFSTQTMTKSLGEAKSGVWSLGPSEDYSLDPMNSTLLRVIGQGLRLGIVKSTLFISNETPLAIDAAAPGSAKLAQLRSMKQLAIALDEAKCFSAVLAIGAGGNIITAENDPRIPAGLAPVVDFGVGISSGVDVTIVYAQANSEDAQSNLPILEGFLQSKNPVGDVFTLASIVRSENLVVAQVVIKPSPLAGAFRVSTAAGNPLGLQRY